MKLHSNSAVGGFYHFSCKADRKDPTHSGHTDSVYYAHVKARLVSDLKRLEFLLNAFGHSKRSWDSRTLFLVYVLCIP